MNEFYGGLAVTPMLVPDWNQKNPNRADYIKNKPDIANALKGSASGNPIRLDDVSPLEHEIAVHCERWYANHIQENKVGGIIDFIDVTAESGKVLFVESCTVYEPNEEEDASFCVNFTDGSYASYEGIPNTTINEGMAMCIDEQGFLYYAENLANGATIEKRGVENLFSLADFSYKGSASEVSVEDNKVTSRFVQGGQIKNIVNATCMSDYYNGVKPIPAGTYTFLCNPFKNSKGDIYNPGLDIKMEDGTDKRIEANVPTEVFQSFSPSAVSFVSIVPMIETATHSTSLQLVKAGVYVADENGNVSIIGNGEDFTLLAESGVTISAEYNRDINKAFAEIQQAIAAMGAAAVTIPEEV